MTDETILNNIRVLDFTWALAGPYATRLLADFGAEVIKVQPLLSTEANDDIARGYYNTWNRNKLGVTLDLNKPEGLALAKRLVGICDAVVENFTPRVMSNWGLDYENLKKIKPDIIMVSMSIMGQQSPHSHYTGYGPTVHALSGMTRLTSFPDMPPVGPGFSYADHVAGLYASMMMLGALEERHRTGHGRHIDIPELEVTKGLIKEASLEPVGNDSPVAAPHNVYPCSGDSRWCTITVFTDEEWRGLKKSLGSPEWAEDEKFAAMSGRIDNRQELDRLISNWTQRHTAEEVMSLLQENGVPAGIVQDARDIADNPQLEERGFFIQSMPLVDAAPIKLSASSAAYRRRAPEPGQDNDYVYGGLLGISKTRMLELKKKGVI